MMKYNCFILGFLAIAGFWSAHQVRCAADERATREEGPVVLTDTSRTALNTVLKISLENRIPLGIIFGTQPLLCAERAPGQIRAANFSDAFSQAIAGTGYTVTVENNVYVLTGPDTTPHEMSLLNYRFERFSATDSTMNHAGALLNGYIMTVAEGAPAFAVDTMESRSAKKFNVKMQSATTSQIADHIVSLGGKGIWVFRPVKATSPPGGEPSIRIYGYEDNTSDLERLTCE
jgi:hypothetical protein